MLLIARIYGIAVAAVAAFSTKGTTITIVGLALGKIFISRLAHYNAIISDRRGIPNFRDGMGHIRKICVLNFRDGGTVTEILTCLKSGITEK